MSQDQADFLNKLRTTIWTVFGLIMFTVIVATIPFYFNTQNDIENTQDDIKELKSSKADRASYELTVKEIQKDIAEINKKLDNKADKQ